MSSVRTDVVDLLRYNSKKLYFVTNNATYSRSSMLKKFQTLGLKANLVSGCMRGCVCGCIYGWVRSCQVRWRRILVPAVEGFQVNVVKGG